MFAVVEELIERAFKCASHLFQRFDGRDCMTIFYAGYITTQQARTLLDVALGEFLFLAHFAEAVANNHGALLHSGTCRATSNAQKESGSRSPLAFIDDLNIMAVRIKHPGRIIARVVFETSLR